jgi:CCR4-NOT transcription complex subunit 1
MRMLEEIRGAGVDQVLTQSTAGSVKEFVLEEHSSLSLPSLSNFTQASKKVAEATEIFFRNDPTTAKQQVTALVESWIRVQSDPMTSEKTAGQFLQVIQQFGVGKIEEQTERFLRLSTLAVVDAVLGTASTTSDGQRPVLNYTFIDMHSKLLVLLFRHMNSGDSTDQVNAQRLGVLNKILGVAVRSMMWHSEKMVSSGSSWDQRPWFRLFLNLVIDLNKPDPAFESIRLGVLSVFGAAFHVCQPLVMPGMLCRTVFVASVMYLSGSFLILSLLFRLLVCLARVGVSPPLYA